MKDSVERDLAVTNEFARMADVRIKELEAEREKLLDALRNEPLLMEAAKGVVNVYSHRGRKGYRQAMTQGIQELRAALLPVVAKQEEIYAALAAAREKK